MLSAVLTSLCNNEVINRLPSCQHGPSFVVFSPAQLFKTNRYDLSFCVFKEHIFIWSTLKQIFLSITVELLLLYLLSVLRYTCLVEAKNHYSSLIFIPEGNTKSEGCLSQPDEVFWRKIGQSVELPCTISSRCSGRGWQYEWLTCKERACFHLKLHKYPQKYKLNNASLQITTLHANDSGIYHCAAVSGGHQAQGSQHVGLGTTLVVRGRRENQFWIKICLKCCEFNWFNVTDWFPFTFRKR